MAARIGIQLYSVRDLMKEDFVAPVRRIAEIGYAGVEPAGLFDTRPEDAARIFADLGLDVSSAHLPLPVGDARNEVLDTACALGAPSIISGLGPPDFASLDAIRRSADRFNDAAEAARSRGLAFGIHNHWWEFETIDGRPACRHLAAALEPGVFFEVDIYWAHVAGADPATELAWLGERAPLLHVKDGPGVKGQPHLAVGDGVVDIPAALRAAPAAAWHIVELDECATDMMTAVERSFRYLDALS